MINLKKQIDEIYKIKEENNFLYLNNILSKWRNSFKNPPKEILLLNKQDNNHSEQLLNLITNLGKYKEF